MTTSRQQCETTLATAQDVWPLFGLAFVIDDDNVSWGLTKSTAGPGLEHLAPGSRVQLTLDRRSQFSVVRSYQPVA